MADDDANRSPHQVIHVYPHDFKKWLLRHFSGFHHTVANAAGLMKTSLAVVPTWNNKHKGTTSKQVALAIEACEAQNVQRCNTNDGGWCKYIQILDNRGKSLQTRAESAVLTRDVLVLVKGGHAAHAATRCKVDGYVCVTAAHATIEATVLAEMIRQLSIAKQNANDMGRSFARETLHDQFIRGDITVAHLSSIRTLCARIYAEFRQRSLPVALMANVVVAAAAMQTGFTDAGARFRDRTSRQEAARHYAEGILALFHAPFA